jgi:hypothetical protein
LPLPVRIEKSRQVLGHHCAGEKMSASVIGDELGHPIVQADTNAQSL